VNQKHTRRWDSTGGGKLPHAQSAIWALNAPISRPGLSSSISMAPDSTSDHTVTRPETALRGAAVVIRMRS